MSDELRAELEREPGWMYPWQLGEGMEPPLHIPQLEAVHENRERMIRPHVERALAAAGPGARALDLACNEGWFSHRLLEWGAAEVVAIDAREVNVRRARLVRDHLGVGPERLDLRCVDVFAIDADELGEFDVVLLLGLIYHVEDPIGLIRLARRLTRGTCVMESQVTRDRSPSEWLAVDGTVTPAQGSFATYAEGVPDHPLAALGGRLSLIPNRQALLESCAAAGFAECEPVPPEQDMLPWFVEGDRVVLAAR